MLKLVFKPLLVILTLGALLVAMLQVAGRVAFTFLDDLELAANQVLSARNIRVSGLSGDWRMLNPVVHVARLDLPAGHLQDVVFELDLLESMLRGTPLARRLKVADGVVNLEKHPGEPWRLRGATLVNQLDPWPFLEHSDQLEVAGRVRFHRHGEAQAEIAMNYLGINRGGEHRHGLELTNHLDDCPSRCLLRLDYQRREALWPVSERITRLTAGSEGFLVPRPVLGISPVQIAEFDLGWQRRGEDSGGELTLRAEQFDMPGDVTVAVEIEGALRGHQGIHSGSMSRFRVEQGAQTWMLPEISVDADADAVGVWVPALDLGRASAFLRQALAAVEPVDRWLGALNLNGTARNVRASYGFGGGGLRYALTVDGVAMDGFKGVPTVRNAGGELFGHERGLQLNLNAQGMALEFPDVFTGRWQLPYAQGVLQAWFGPDYFGVRGLNLRAETAGTRAAGGFAMSRPPDREGQRLLLLVSTEQIGVEQAKRYIPYKLPDQLQSWLQTAPLGGTLHDATLAYQGQFQEEPGELGRRIELAARLEDAGLRYHPDWPEVTAMDGWLALAGPLVEVDVRRALSAGAKLEGSQVRLVDNASRVNVSLDADTDAGAVLEFLRTTPLRQWITFVEPDWLASGPMRLSGELQVPLGGAGVEPAVRLRGDLGEVDLSMPGYRVALADLDGSFRYRYPFQVDAAEVTGRLFDAPVLLSANTDGDRVHLTFSGRGAPEDVWNLIDMKDPGLARGEFDFYADLGLGVANGAVTTLAVTSSLEGTAIDLPAGYGKLPREALNARVEVDFLPDHRAVAFNYRDATGWLDFDEAPLRGAIGFADLPRAREAVADALVLGGRLARFELEDVLPEDAAGEGGSDGAGVGLALPVGLDGLHVGAIGLGDFDLTRATLNGRVAADGLALSVDSAEVSGTLERQGSAPLQALLTRVSIPDAGESEEGEPGAERDGPRDPLSPDIISELPAADVTIDALTLGEEEYGSWRFEMRPRDGDLVVAKLQATVRGVDILAPEGLVWRSNGNETRFQGRLQAGNLADVLPQWGYAPNVETESAALEGAFTWAGSPLMVDILRLVGEAEVAAEQGRFLDVESGAGALKIFSLLNFTAIAKRVTLNFSDVFGRGVSFDELNAEFSLDRGLLEFLEPMEVDGTGSEFRVTGTVDLAERRLDTDMIVTLPVTKSLPWYAAYVALANPLAGLGVLVGERMLRKPLEQFSSARYHISGTLDDPEVKFVSVFDVTPVETEGATESRSEPQSLSGAPTIHE